LPCRMHGCDAGNGDNLRSSCEERDA